MGFVGWAFDEVAEPGEVDPFRYHVRCTYLQMDGVGSQIFELWQDYYGYKK